MGASVAKLVLSTLGPMLIQLASAKVLKEILLWAANLGVKSTKTTHDDELLAIIKKAWEDGESSVGGSK